MSVTLRFQSTGSIPGDGSPVTMRGPSLTIGRGNENDLVLPDPDRMLSKRHCAIEDHNGNIIVVDFSTNGTFLNYGKLALGSVPTPINDGDILTLGPYELLVCIASDQPSNQIADPLDLDPVSHGIAARAPTTAELLDAPGDGGDFLDDLLGGREGPVGPSGVNRAEPDDDGLLPPLGDDDPLIPPAADPFAHQGASAGMHNPSAQDHFATPQPAVQSGGGAIPDDWDDDFLAPTGNASDPFGQAAPAAPSAPIAPPPAAAASIPDDFGLDDFAPAPPQAPAEPAPAPEAPTIETAQTEPVDNDDLISTLTEDAAPSPEPEPEPEPQSEPEPDSVVADETASPAEPAAEHQSGAASDDAAARAFLKAVGAADVAVSDADLTATMSRMGHVLRIMIEGMREILMTRTSIKSEFRIEQTMIQAGGNNPLKFSITPEQAIEAMVKPSAKGYLDATDAAEEALKDIKAHEVAMVTGMESAIKGILTRLDPKVLEEKISVSGGFSSVLKSKKARYWEIYESMYAEISDQAENDFHELFAKEFGRAYQEQLDKLK